MSEAREDLLLEIEQKLIGFTVEGLYQVCQYCSIAGEDNADIKDKTRRALVKLVMQFCERRELLDSDDEGMSLLLALNDAVDSMRERYGGTSVTTASGKSDQMSGDHLNAASSPPATDASSEGLQNEATQQSSLHSSTTASEGNVVPQHHQPTLQDVTIRNTGHIGAQHRGRESMGSNHGSNSCCLSSNAAYRREFRINGHIGESNQRDNLSFSSLEHQIESGLRKGYPDMEIVEAVIRAVNPGAKLRSYLEGKIDLTLDTLRQILRAHYAEKDATDLYQQLTKAVQAPGETSLDFLIRVLDLRQKVLFASERSQSGLKYNRELVQSQCFQSILTGLANDNIRAEMRFPLQNVDSSDELLLEKMQIAQYNENERNQKTKAMNRTLHRTNVNAVETDDSGDIPQAEPVTVKATKPTKDNSLFAKIEESSVAIKELTCQVASLVQTVQRERATETSPQRRSANSGYRRPNRRCQTCQQQNVPNCNHCWKCGSDSHFALGCRAGNAQRGSGNGQRL